MFLIFGEAYPASNLRADAQKPYLVREFTLDGAGILKTFTLSGNIEVQTYASNKVRVELYVERGYAIWSQSRNLDNYRINVLQRGNEVVASVEERKRSGGLFGDKISFNFKIYVPEHMSSELRTLGGNIQLRGLTGDQMAKTSGGNIILHDLKGKIGAYTTGGRIEIRNNSGTIFAQTEGGDITADRAEGELRLRTAGGNITSEHISGSFIARADAGNIHGQFYELGQGISMETSAGNIYAELPRNIGVDLTATGSLINVTDLQNFEGRKTERTIEGRLNDGGIPVQLRTSSGNITLKTH